MLHVGNGLWPWKVIACTILVPLTYLFLYASIFIFSYWYVGAEIPEDVDIIIAKKSFLRLLYISGIALAYFYAREGIRKAAMGDKEKNLRIGLENANFRSQVSTHLLFNTLWFVYTQIERLNKRAAEAIMLLSKVMTYLLETSRNEGKILLTKEIEYVKDYIELMKIRTTNNFYLNVEMDTVEVNDTLLIPSGIFGNFISNVFKHGILTRADDPARIKIIVASNLLMLHTRNLKSDVPTHESTGMGMDHITTALDQWYGDKYDLEVKQTETHYDLYFRIQL